MSGGLVLSHKFYRIIGFIAPLSVLSTVLNAEKAKYVPKKQP